MEESRLKETLKKRAYRNVIIALGGLIILILIFILFGTQLLIGFSLLLETITGKKEPITVQQVQTNYISPPQLDSPVEATNSARINITGTGLANQLVNLYRNDQFIGTTAIDSKTNFMFKLVTLQAGDNTFKAKSIVDNKDSDFSNTVTVIYLHTAPSLSITNPQDGQTFKKDGGQVKVTGETDPGAEVTVNDFRAIVESGGSYYYFYTLKDGDNNLKIVATDAAGNKTTKEITIKTE